MSASPPVKCEDCGDVGWVVDNGGKALPCRCVPRPLAKHGQNFGNFEAVPGTEEALAASREFAGGVGLPWLLLHGPYGCGKSHLMKAIGCVHAAKPSYTGLVDLMEAMKGMMDTGGWADVMERYQRCELLLLDDLGAGREKATAWVVEQTYRLLDYRYQRKLPTAIATNLDFERIVYAFDGRIASRMFDQRLVRVVGMTAKDYRTGKEW